MSVHDDGGPAYPVVELDPVTGRPVDQYTGITIRDWFAGQFLSTYVTDSDLNPKDVAKFCYRMADEMIAERAKR
jgi:hypothetical protein